MKEAKPYLNPLSAVHVPTQSSLKCVDPFGDSEAIISSKTITLLFPDC